MERKLRERIDVRAVLIVEFEHATPTLRSYIEMPIKHFYTFIAMFQTSYPLLEMPKTLEIVSRLDARLQKLEPLCVELHACPVVSTKACSETHSTSVPSPGSMYSTEAGPNKVPGANVARPCGMIQWFMSASLVQVLASMS